MREGPTLALAAALLACNGDKAQSPDTAGYTSDTAEAPDSNASLSNGRNPGCVTFNAGKPAELTGLLATLESGPSDLWECTGTLLADEVELGIPVATDGAGNLNWTGIANGSLAEGRHEICIRLGTDCPTGAYNYAIANEPDFVVSAGTYTGGEFPVKFAEITQ